jgi:hypothetical protein
LAEAVEGYGADDDEAFDDVLPDVRHAGEDRVVDAIVFSMASSKKRFKNRDDAIVNLIGWRRAASTQSQAH